MQPDLPAPYCHVEGIVMHENGVSSDRTIVACSPAKAELERLLGDARLHLTDRNRSFLRYAAEQTFAGNTKGAKAYAIAIDVFGRPSNFDPALDPIVRIEAARIRAALEQYYDAYGEPGGIRITLPRGHYVAEFTHIDGCDADVLHPDGDIPLPVETVRAANQPMIDARTWFRLTPWQLGAALATVCVCSIAVIFLAGVPSTDKPAATYTFVGKPLVRFTTSNKGFPTSEKSENPQQNLLAAVSGFGTLRLSGSDIAIAGRSVGPGRQRFDDMGFDLSDYQINVTYDFKQTVHSVTWTVVETKTDETIASGSDSVAVLAGSVAETDVELVGLLARRLGSPLGILGSNELSRHAVGRTIGNVCVLQGDYAVMRASRDDLADARACLEATISANRRDSDAYATLSRVVAAEDELDGSSANSARALELANTALALSARSDRALGARMIALFAVGRPEAALVIGKQALASNPLNTSTAGSLALRLYTAGFWLDGVSFAKQATRLPNSVSAEGELTLVLDAYRTGHGAEAIRQLDTMLGDDALCASIRIATLARMGKKQQAASAFAEASKLDPTIRTTLSQLMQERRFDPGLSAMLAHDVALADSWRSKTD